jgi:hypothetical protein
MNDVKTLEWAGWLAARSIHESYGEDPDDSLLLSDLESARREMMGTPRDCAEFASTSDGPTPLSGRTFEICSPDSSKTSDLGW